MGVLMIIFLLILACIGIFLLFKIVTWVSREKARIFWMFFLLAGIIVSITMYKVFFVKMEFIQSKVYPDLYLIKNPDTNKNKVNNAIKEKVLQTIKLHRSDNQKYNDMQLYTLRFYQYSKGDLGENGTAYFIEHKEKPEGMLPELLEYYPEYLLAEFSMQPCKEDSSGYFGKLSYYNETKRIKIDTILNSCKKQL